MSSGKMHRSLKVLAGSLLLACGGVVATVSNIFVQNKSLSPRDVPNLYILIVTFSPLVLLVLIRLMSNLFGAVHSSRERAGQVATSIGVLHLTVTTTLYYQLGITQSFASVQALYAVLAVAGIFVLLLGDVLRNFEHMQSAVNRP